MTARSDTAQLVPFLDLGAMHREVGAELDAVWRAVTTSNAFIGGPHVAAFEAAWAEYCGVVHCIGVGNGTDAIALALAGLGVGAGDEVIVPTNTYVATATAIVETGATPVFVDVDPGTLLVTADHVRAALTPRTAAVVPVHLYGQMADMGAICEVASRAGIVVVEDAAQAHGATWQGRRAGCWGAAATFSFYPGKNLGAFGDGGAIVTNDDVLATRFRLANNHGRSPGDRFVHLVAGRNSRLDGLQAAVLTAKLLRLDAWNDGRRRAHAMYASLLDGAPLGVPAIHPDAVAVHHVESVLLEDPVGTARLLGQDGIETNRHYPVPCHQQPAFAHLPAVVLPVAEAAARRQLSLPMHPHLDEATIARVCTALRRAIAGADAHG